MWRGGRNLVLLCAAFLLISSAVNGVPDEVHQLQKFLRARPLGGGEEIAHDGEAIGKLKAWPVVEENPAAEIRENNVEMKALTAEPEEKTSQGVAAKVWSYLSRFTNPLFDNGVFNPAGRLEKTKVVRPEEEIHGHRHRHRYGHHHGVIHSFFRGIRDSIWKRPVRNAAVISASEPLVLEEDVRAASGEGFEAKMAGIVGKVLEEYYASSVAPEEATTCVGILEEQVKKLVKSLKFALKEQICEEGMSSLPEQKFCNLFSVLPKRATMMVFAKADVNPVTVALMRTSTAGFCASAADNSNFLGSVNQVERLARHLPMHMLSRQLDSLHYDEHEEPHMPGLLHRHKYEHKELDHADHHMSGMFRRSKPDHVDPDMQLKPQHEENGHENHNIFGMFRRHKHDHEEHDMPRMFHEHEHEHKEHDHEGHHMFGMFHKLKHEYEERKKHHELEHVDQEGRKHWWQQAQMKIKAVRAFDSHDNGNSCKECFLRGVQHLARGIKMHLAITCQSATSPKLIAACTFAREHKFLTKTYLAVKIPVWDMVAFHCRRLSCVNAPILGVDHIGRELGAEQGEDVASASESDVKEHLHLGTEIPQLVVSEPHFPRLGHWMSGGCAKHRARQAFRKALHLRGHVIGISSRNENGEDGFPGLVRTHLVVLRGPLHTENFQDAVANAQTLEPGHFRDMFSDLQDQMTKLVGAAVSSESEALPDLKTDMMLFKPLHEQPDSWTHVRNFRISARPHFAPALEENKKPGLLTSLKEGVRNFRISARPRSVPLLEGKEIPTKVDDTDESTQTTDFKIEMPDTSEEGARAEM